MEYLKALSAQRIVNIEASSRAILDQVIAANIAIGLMMLINDRALRASPVGGNQAWSSGVRVPVASSGRDRVESARESLPVDPVRRGDWRRTC